MQKNKISTSIVPSRWLIYVYWSRLCPFYADKNNQTMVKLVNSAIIPNFGRFHGSDSILFFQAASYIKVCDLLYM